MEKNKNQEEMIDYTANSMTFKSILFTYTYIYFHFLN